MPSENAPAPENPVVMLHGLQFMQCPVLSLGQWRRSTGRPFSSMTMRVCGRSSISLSAVKMPDGPAPTMTTSVFM